MNLLLLLLLSAPAPAETPGDPPADAEELPILEGPGIVEYVEAPYPDEAREAGLEGVVLLLVEIDEEGTVTHVEVLDPIGYGFDEAALQAVQSMRFSPARTAEGPVPVAFEFEYGFELRPDEPLIDEPPPVNLEGTVRQMGTRRPVEGARVVVDGTDLVAITDADGRFELRGVPLGTPAVRVLHPDHLPLQQAIEVVEGEVTDATLWVRAEAWREHEAVGVYRAEQQDVTRRTLHIEEVRRVPGTFGDPVRVVQTLPGAARSPFGTGFLVIRGSNPEDSAVYVDGIRLPIIYHLTGTTAVIAPELVESVDYLPGGYGVQYGRSMGGVVDVTTRQDFDEGRLTWGADILDANVYYEGRLGREGRHGLAVGARRSYIDVFLPLFMRGDFVIQPRYWDYQVKWVPELEGSQDLSLFVYGFHDLLAFGTPEDVAQGSDQHTQGDFRTTYASQRMVAQYRRQLADDLQFVITPSLGVDYGAFDLGGLLRLDNTNLITEVRAELPWQATPAVEIVPGLDLIGGLWRFDFASPFRWTDLDDPLAEREAVTIDGRGSGWGPDLYLKANLRPLADRERWLVVPGVRYNLVNLTWRGSLAGDEPQVGHTIQAVDPRLLSRFRLLEHTWLKGSTGLYHQPPQPHELVGVGTRAQTGFERAWSSSFGFEQQLGPALHADIDLFYKHKTDLVVFNEQWMGFGDTVFFNQGRGRAYGVELILRRARVDRFFGWLSYTLSKSERQDHPDDPWEPFEFDQPHIFSAQGGLDLPHGFGVSAQVQYVSGNPTTPYNAGIYDADGGYTNPFRVGPYRGERLPPYFQTSVRFDRTWTFRSWELLTYVDLMNVVRGVNPEFTLYNHDYSQNAYLRGLPFIPNIGIEGRFWP